MVDAAVTSDVMQSGSNLGTCRKEADLIKNHMPSRQAIVIGMTKKKSNGRVNRGQYCDTNELLTYEGGM